MAEVPYFRSEASPAPDNLLYSAHVRTDPAVIAGGNFVRGTLMGQITASKKWTISTAAATDGSQTPAGILVDDAPAASADVAGGVYRFGEFNANRVTYGAGHTAASVRDALYRLGIALNYPVPA